MKISNTIVHEYSNTTRDGKYAYTYNEGKNDIDLEGAIKFYLKKKSSKFMRT